MRVSNSHYLNDFLEAGGYKNGVGGRVVELFDRSACLSIVSSSESIGGGKVSNGQW